MVDVKKEMADELREVAGIFRSDDDSGAALTRIDFVGGELNERTEEVENATREETEIHAQTWEHTRELDEPPFSERVDGVINFKTDPDAPALEIGDLVEYQGERYEVTESNIVRMAPGHEHARKGRIERVEREHG